MCTIIAAPCAGTGFPGFWKCPPLVSVDCLARTVCCMFYAMIIQTHNIFCFSSWGHIYIGVSNSGFLLLSSGSGLASMPKRERVTPGHVRGLNTLLGNNEFCRKRLLKEGSLLKWPSPKLTGIISMKALRLNRAVMRRVAEILCPQDQHPLSIRVPGIKQEAGQ